MEKEKTSHNDDTIGTSKEQFKGPWGKLKPTVNLAKMASTMSKVKHEIRTSIILLYYLSGKLGCQ